MVNTRIHPDKIAAYRATRYRVGAGEQAFDLTIDVRSDPLRTLYRSTGETCALFITAFNPYGRPQSNKANEAAHARLGQDLRAQTSHVFEGAGADPTGAWPPEKSFLALGVDETAAHQFGMTFHQDAVVWAGDDATPQL